MYSLRRVLAARFSLTMLVALSCVASWALVSVRRTLVIQTDVALAGILQLQALRLAAGERIPEQPGTVDFVPLFDMGARLAIVRDASGAVVQASSSALEGFPLDTVALMAALSGRTARATEQWRNERIRTIYAPAPPGGPPNSVLEVAASLVPLATATRDLLIALAGIVLIGTGAVAVGSFRVATSAVTPVREVALQAQRIRPDDEATRITVHADVLEYQNLITVINDLLDRSELAFNAQRRLIGDVGHELRTPLTSLRGELEIALRAPRTPAEYQQVMRSGLEEIDRLSRMCDALLLITRADSRTLALHLEPTDINDIALRSLHAVRQRVEERDLTITTRLEYAAEPVLVDPQLVLRMVDEIVRNAVNSSVAGGHLTVGTRRTGDQVVVWVEDSGPGIAEEDLPHLFEPFFRADPARSRSDGSGLGLSLASSIARVHGGNIRASNVLDHGARFEIQLPSRVVPTNGRGVSPA
jgi:signal transduction histidine kinase